MAKKWIVQHTGFPTSGPIREDQWATYSTHTSEDAAYKAIKAARAHLDYGQWDDHYRVIAPDGSRSDYNLWMAKQEEKEARRGMRNFFRR